MLMKSRKLTIALLPVVLILSALSCARQAKIPKLEKVHIVWPLPPDPPRIKYISSFTTPYDLGIKEGFLKRAGSVIFGKKRESRLERPYAVALLGKDTILVTDIGTGALHIFDLKKGRYKQVTGAGPEKMISPVGVGVIGETIIVSDSAIGKVFSFSDKGKFIGVFTDEKIERPTGIAVDALNMKVAVADSLSHKVLIFNYEGKLLGTIGGHGEEKGLFNFPTHLAYDKSGRLYVVDAMNFRVQIFTPDKKLFVSFGNAGDGTGYFARSKGITVDSDGNIYIVEGLFDVVQIFSIKGDFLLGFGSSGKSPGSFWLPAGICISDDDKIYIADAYNSRVQVYQYIKLPEEVPTPK